MMARPHATRVNCKFNLKFNFKFNLKFNVKFNFKYNLQGGPTVVVVGAGSIHHRAAKRSRRRLSSL